MAMNRADTKRAGRRLRRVAVATTLALAALAVTASASEAPQTVAVGGVPALSAGARMLGSVPSRTPLRLTLVFTPRDPAALAAFAKAVTTPGSPSFRHFLSVSQFAARFGATADAVATVRRTLRGDGLATGALAPDGLSIPASGSAAQASRAFNVGLSRYRERAGRQVYVNTAAPRLPGALGGIVADVLGLDNLQAAVPEGLVRDASKRVAHAASSPFPGGGGPQPCPEASTSPPAATHYLINQVAGAYGMSGLYANGDFGLGVRVALYELDSYPNQVTDLQHFQQCFGTTTAVSDTQVPPGPIDDHSAETSVDIENVIGLAPQSSIVVYQGANTSAGQYDTLAAIVNAPFAQRAQVISDSWGQCETTFTKNNGAGLYQVTSEAALLQQAAVQGQTFLVSSGDRGSEGCDTNTNNDPTGQLAVDDPASQPYATGVGGTALNALGPPPSESAWLTMYIGGSGGGISSINPMPTYQAYSGVPGVINSYSTGALCPSGSAGYCREVPDVAADGSPHTGYVIFYNGAWVAVGGTSTATPIWAGLIALADASGINGCTPSNPLGFVNPLLYEVAAGSAHASAFNDVTAGDNYPAFLPGGLPAGGPYPATPGYDMTTGLGTPIATDGSSPGLVAQVCAAATARPIPVPTVSDLSAHDAASGTRITVDGSNFTPYSGVAFGSTAAKGVVLISPSQLSVIVPPGQGIVDVTAYTVAGPSLHVATDSFTFGPSETIASPVAGASYTQTQALTAAYSCAASTPGTPGCSATVPNGGTIDTSSVGQHQFSVTAIDDNGVSSTTTSTYTVVAPPTVAISSPADGGVYTRGQVLTAAFGCATSAPVAIASCTAPVANASPIDTATPGAYKFTASATDSNGIASTTTVTYRVVERPQATVTRPANGARYVLGQRVAAAFACSDPPPARIVSCAATAANGARINTGGTGRHRFTLVATDANGVSTQLTVSYTVVARRPRISKLRQTAANWLEDRRPGARLPIGTRFSFSLDQAATVTLRFARSASGRIDAGRCVAPALTRATAPPCTRLLGAGSLTRSAPGGDSTLVFTGSTTTGRLGPGSYTVTLTATGLSGQPSRTVSLHFTVAAPTA